MKFILQLFLFMISIQALAFKYDFKPSSKYNGLDLYEISQQLKTSSFVETDLTRAGRFSKLSYDQLFINVEDTQQFAIVVFDLTPSEKIKIFEVNNKQIVCHAETVTGRPFALFVSDKSFAKTISYCQPEKRSGGKSLIFKSLLNDAKAAECHSINNQLESSIFQMRDTVSNQTTFLIQKLGTCISQALHGGVDHLTEFPDRIKALLSLDPVKLWETISNQAIAMKNFLMNVVSETQKMISNFKNLDPELLMNMICKTSGEIIVDGLLTSGAAGIAIKVSEAMVKLITRSEALKNAFSNLSRLKNAGRIDLANEVLSCAN